MRFENFNIYLFITAIITLIVSLIAYFIISKKTKKKGYDDKAKIATLEEVRDTLEKQMYNINERLLQSEERWKDVNHLLLQQNVKELKPVVYEKRTVQYSEFLRANGINSTDLMINNRLIFILTPFNNLYYSEYVIIRDTCTSMGFTCLRGDEHIFKGDIFPEMLKFIVQSRVVIANINGRNPNVLYELGVAQALDKNVILVSKDASDIPLDIQSQRFLIYNDSESLKNLVHAEISKLL